MNDPVPTTLPAGATLAHYRVEEAVGEGSMGTVYRASDTSLDRIVGLKVLKPDVAKDAHFVRRFVREARAAARVTHPNLTHIYFIGEEEGKHFFAMEYVDGLDLEAWVERHGPLDIDQALDVLIQSARGLGAAHRVGVVHRDVKPSNIILQPDGMARITDFGLAKSLGTDVETTAAGRVTGTPTYMSPEQCRGNPVDARTDVYALGLTAFFLLAGRRPYESAALGAMLDDQINRPLPPLQPLRAEVPEEVEHVLRRMCAKRPEDRLPDMAAVADALVACRSVPVPPAPLMTRAFAAGGDFISVMGIVAIAHLAMERFFGISDSLDHPVGLLGALLLFAAYHLVCDAKGGLTIWKWFFGIQARSARGAAIPLRALLPRLLLRYPWLVVAPLGLTDLDPPFQRAGDGIQILAVASGAAVYLWTRGRTLSDICTRTCVTYRVRKGLGTQGQSSSTK